MTASPPLTEPDLTERRRLTRVRWVLLLTFAVIPLTFLQNVVLGLQLSGWAWFTVLCAAAPLALTEPLSRRALRRLAPYLAVLCFAGASLSWTTTPDEGLALLVQLWVPVLVYVLAYRIADPVRLLPAIRSVCLWGLAAAAVIAVVTLALGSPLGLDLSTPRPMAISLVVLFVGATADSRTPRYTLLVGLAALTVAMGTGSRMSAAVLVAVVLASPSLRLTWRGRAAVGAAALLLLVMISQTDAFRERFFFSDSASLLDVVTMSEQVNTAGRRELWPRLVDACSPMYLTGMGIGASYDLSDHFTSGAMPHPHNEYLRTYCDVGLPASVAFWAFFALAGIRSWRGALRSGESAGLHGAAGLLVGALAVLALTDNPLAYTGHFMAPLAVLLGLSDKLLPGGFRPPTRAPADRRPARRAGAPRR